MHGSAHHRTGRFLALLGALLLTLAACSGSGDAETDPAALPTTEAIETEETPTELDTGMATEAPTDMTIEPESTETDAADTGTGTGSDAAASGEDILAALEDAGLTSLAAAFQAVGFEEEIANLPAFTLFAPNDDALLSMGQDLTTMDPLDVQNVLNAHIVDEQILTSDLSEGENTFTTVGGSELTVTSEGGEVTVGEAGATVTQADIEVGDSGVVHVIDGVLEPAS